jgi:dTDP-4-dehydrorhamnose reductase
MVGRSWCELLEREGVPFDAWGRTEHDLADPDAAKKLRDRGARWDLIVNCGAYTQVDKAETDYDLAERVNGTAIGELAASAKQLGARLVHYSTDYVFNGQATSPYPVDAAIEPINAYGRSKALGERLLQESGAESLLIRTSWVYAPWGKNFVATMARLLREKPELRVVADQRGRPTSAQQLAARSWALCQQGALGVFHLTDGDECTWHEFAVGIRDALGLPTPVHPITTAEFPTPAIRPAYSVLDLSRADALIGPPRPWREALEDVLRHSNETR